MGWFDQFSGRVARQMLSDNEVDGEQELAERNAQRAAEVEEEVLAQAVRNGDYDVVVNGMGVPETVPVRRAPSLAEQAAAMPDDAAREATALEFQRADREDWFGKPDPAAADKEWFDARPSVEQRQARSIAKYAQRDRARTILADGEVRDAETWADARARVAAELARRQRELNH